MPDLATVAPIMNANLSNGVPTHVLRGTWASILPSRKWELHSTCGGRRKILGNAFGQIHSPYWGEEREKVVPTYELVNEILYYLRSLSHSDDDLAKLLKKFPEILGRSLKHELRTNVHVLEKEWGIKGKSL
ncbi:DNA mismatch repair protein [Sarracenia purpurea var. burkii]